MSESVACALEFMDNDNTQQTLLFIKMVDRFFDYLNVKSPLMAQWKRKESIAPRTSHHKTHSLKLVVIHCTCTQCH